MLLENKELNELSKQLKTLSFYQNEHIILNTFDGYYYEPLLNDIIISTNFKKCEYVNLTPLKQRIIKGKNIWIC